MIVNTAVDEGATEYAEDESATISVDETESADELPLADEVLALAASPELEPVEPSPQPLSNTAIAQSARNSPDRPVALDPIGARLACPVNPR